MKFSSILEKVNVKMHEVCVIVFITDAKRLFYLKYG